MAILIVVGYNFFNEDVCINFEVGVVVCDIWFWYYDSCGIIKSICRVYEWIKFIIIISVYVWSCNFRFFFIINFN